MLVLLLLEFKVFFLRLQEAQSFWSLHQSRHNDSDKLSIINIYTTLTYRQVVEKKTLILRWALPGTVDHVIWSKSCKNAYINNLGSGIKTRNLCFCVCMCEEVCYLWLRGVYVNKMGSKEAVRKGERGTPPCLLCFSLSVFHPLLSNLFCLSQPLGHLQFPVSLFLHYCR